MGEETVGGILEKIAIERFISLAKNKNLPKCKVSREVWGGSPALVIDTPDLDVAWGIWHDRKKLFYVLEELNLGEHLMIKIKGKIFGAAYCPPSHLPKIPTMSPIEQKLLERVQRHTDLIRAISRINGIAAAVIHDASEKEGFRYLDIYAQYPDRLNKPKDVMLFAPATIVDTQLADLRVHHLKEAVHDGQEKHYEYTYHWDGLLWRFNCSVVPIAGSQEVLSVVSDAEAWQTEYWKNKVSANQSLENH